MASRRSPATVVGAVITVFLAVGWFAFERHLLQVSNRQRAHEAISSAQKVVESHREQLRAKLRQHAEHVANQNWFQSSIFTDDATIQDALIDNVTYNPSDARIFLVLNSAFAVRAQLPEKGLHSDSDVRASLRQEDGSFPAPLVIGTKVYEIAGLSTAPDKRTRKPSYVVAGQAIDPYDLSELTNSLIAIVAGNKTFLGSQDSALQEALSLTAWGPSTTEKSVTVGTKTFLALAQDVGRKTAPIWFVSLVAVDDERWLFKLLLFVPVLASIGLACVAVWRYRSLK